MSSYRNLREEKKGYVSFRCYYDTTTHAAVPKGICSCRRAQESLGEEDEKKCN